MRNTSFRCLFRLVTLLTVATSPALADNYIKIGAWNIQNLGDRTLGQFPAALAEHVFVADLDVLCLEEIWDTDGNDATITSTKLDETFERVNHEPGHDWTYVLFPKRDPTELMQHVGIAWNRKRLQMVGEPLRIPVEYANEETWKRTPYAAKFSVGDGATDFVLIPLHMKSNRPVEGLPEPVELRTAEAIALGRYLQSVRDHFQDQDLILLGDLNCLKADEPALETLLAAGFKDLNNEDAITYRTTKYLSPFDRILVPLEQSEFRYSEQYILTPARGKQHFNRYSDHFLVLTAIRVLADDD
ncbi:MAG: endonuclease/exonuclease/phosphatase family protein [Planctomycetaceae bacterium]|nr:endonuclease/exonuclease/phosphatase family protein [Planctomycetaceae bacterium]